MQPRTNSRTHNNSRALENSQGQDVTDKNEQDNSMFNDDDDLDIAEIDQALLGEKTPLAAEKTQEKNNQVKTKNSAKTGQMSTNQRYIHCVPNKRGVSGQKPKVGHLTRKK